MKATHCRVEDCEKPVEKHKGLCSMHRSRWKRHRSLEQPRGRRRRGGFPPPLERFTRAPQGCWLWLGAIDRDGYGQVWDGRTRLAHRYVYEQLRGAIPMGLELDHLCTVKSCVNPDHLEPVTHAENMRRMRVARAGLVPSRSS